ncbi:MAG: endolytic transglycosylase MltG [Parcubacteria group bacterium]|nr:endolytic transglycosylase MltG [Parcubacteria group bacterium]
MFKTIKKIIAVIFLLLFCGAGLLAFFCYRTFMPYKPDDNSQQEFAVKPGDGVNQISARLVEEDLVPNNFYIDTYLWLIKSEDKLKAGAYTLSPAMSAQEIADKLIAGAMEDRQVVIPEGWTREDIADAFVEYHVDHYTGGEDIEAVRSQFEIEFVRESSQLDKYRSDYSFLEDAPQGATLEGYLFPDTYEVYSDATPEEIIEKILDNFGKKVDSNLLAKIKNQNKTVFEVVNLAAIVEREVREEDEMKKVAGVYQNRLDISMKLQSDATITYITKGKDPQPTFEETRVDSPYNTYLHAGLPPAPIGNPGLQAIKSAINPAEHNYLFFITKLDTGEAIFAETGEQHLENKKRYLDK